MVKGNAAFVLPSFRNTSYINVLVGDHFGVADIISSAERNQFEIDKWYEKRSQLKRQFTVMAQNNIEV